MECGGPVAAPARTVVSERRVVTIFFCDLVGFTSRSELLDPEDVRAFLVPYYDLLVAEVERHGGVVDKFTGDGAMVSFGVPVAHEDDPERAIRMGLRLLELLPELGLDLHVRVGINTGEVLFAVEAYGTGDAITGDAANTAKRIEGLAPTDGIAVGERTWQATREVFEFEELEPAAVKGKAEPLRVFRVLAPKARFGIDLIRTRGTPFVGREAELDAAARSFERGAHRPARPARHRGRRARSGKEPASSPSCSPPSPSDPTSSSPGGRDAACPTARGSRSGRSGRSSRRTPASSTPTPPRRPSRSWLEVLPEGDQRPWLRERLRPLLGIDAAAAEREELFAAWARFLEHVASLGPAVLVFEDLHWADDAMLAFLEHAAEHVDNVPLLLLGTARPELAERHPDFGRDLENLTRIELAPLTEAETGRLVSGLLDAAMVPAEVQQPILERAGGNPLFAEEFVRLLRDQQLIVRAGSSWELTGDGELPLPESLHALIAARLDLLPPEAKSMLADAAVIGKVFWAGALAHMGERDPADVRQTLAQLAGKELLRPAQRSSIEGEAEYAFWHALVRDVAYGQLPRAARATRHAAAAAWIENTVGERVGRARRRARPPLLHRARARPGLRRRPRRPARTTRAQIPHPRRRTRAPCSTPAPRSPTWSAPSHSPPRDTRSAPASSCRWPRRPSRSATLTEATAALEEALEAFTASGDHLAAARTKAMLASWHRDWPAMEAANEEVLALLEPLGPSPELVEALSERTYAVAGA